MVYYKHHGRPAWEGNPSEGEVMFIVVVGYVDGHVSFIGPFENEEAGKQYCIALCEQYTSIYRWHVVPIIHPLNAGERH